jgi:hypothetical protein
VSTRCCCILEYVTDFRIDPTRGRQERCDRCGSTFEDGYTWPGLGVPVVLCNECTTDIEQSVESYGESGVAKRQRLFDRLRAIGLTTVPAARGRRAGDAIH